MSTSRRSKINFQNALGAKGIPAALYFYSLLVTVLGRGVGLFASANAILLPAHILAGLSFSEFSS